MRILNLGILAHVDAGKTSLTERLLFDAGVIATIGSVDAGSTQTDSLALERQRGITIKTAVASFVVGDTAINLIDTPGHPDFIAEVERVLNVLDGAVLGRCMQKHTHKEFIRFLGTIEREVPAGKVIHAIADNYATHKHPKVRAWLANHPRWVFHFTPTSASWLNAVENFFSALTRRRIRRGVFKSIVDLQAAINRYIQEHNDNPKPFLWTKPPPTPYSPNSAACLYLPSESVH